MKTNFFKFATIALCAVAVVSCSDSSDDSDVTVGGGEGTTEVLYGSLSADKTLLANSTYELSGAYTVESGATLTIQEGVTILAQDDSTVDYILIEQGAKINAQGTASNPIVMTSELKEHGAWGGLHICGYAKINCGSGAEGTITAKSEIGNSTYGGNNDADNSGVLSYVRIEYAGYAFSEDSEANGFSFYGVGSGTTLEYLQAYKGGDDGFEWFGGCVDAKYLIATDNNDDSFDWTYGFRGKIQYAIAEQGEGCDCLVEADSNSESTYNTVISHVALANVSFTGETSGSSDSFIKARVGSEIEVYNAIFEGNKNYAFHITGDRTNDYVVANPSKFAGIYADNTSTSFVKGDFYSSLSYDLGLSFAGTVAQAATATPVDVTALGFDAVDFVGAVGSEDWTAGWSLAL